MAARTTTPVANTAPMSTVVLVTIGERRGALTRWMRTNKVRTFAAHYDAPGASFAPAKKNYEPRDYPAAIEAWQSGEKRRGGKFVADVMAAIIDLESAQPEGAAPVHVVVVIDTLAVTYDPEAKIYPTVAGGDSVLALREMADEVITVS